jgi:hypothetical protein
MLKQRGYENPGKVVLYPELRAPLHHLCCEYPSIPYSKIRIPLKKKLIMVMLTDL